ncbi:MAG: manganese efflux pump [Lachnospiraceae bacterium]|nr:manganese efflux pump [Lachnospiraceae bacterium]
MGFGMIINSILLGIGLAMDAFSVSLANGLNEPGMKKGRIITIAGVFSLFQFAMPLIGWICVSTVARYFALFEKAVPWIALVLLTYIGGKMLYDGIKGGEDGEEVPALGIGELMLQGVATSIDALSVGFTIAAYSLAEAFISCVIIGIVTFFICFTGITIGKKAGTALAGKAGILGGVILIFIGIEIFVSNMF